MPEVKQPVTDDSIKVRHLSHYQFSWTAGEPGQDGTYTLQLVLEDLGSVAKKIKRAVTDAEAEVRFDPVAKPGVSNLLSLLAVATGAEPAELAARYTQYGPLKSDTADAVVELLRPVQARYAELLAEPGHVEGVLTEGAERARAATRAR